MMNKQLQYKTSSIVENILLKDRKVYKPINNPFCHDFGFEGIKGIGG